MSGAEGAQGSAQEGSESVTIPSVLLPYKETTCNQGQNLSNDPSSSSSNPSTNPTTFSEAKDDLQAESKPKKKPRPSTKSSGDGSSRRNAASRSEPTKGTQWDASYYTSINAGLIGTASLDVPQPGWLPAGGGFRKMLPEMAMPFNLPSITRHVADVGSTQEQDDANVSALDSSEDSDSAVSYSEDDDDSDTSTSTSSSLGQSPSSIDSQSSSHLKRKRREARQQDRNLIYIQSLRQSRLFYLSSFLPVYSHRLRNGHYYFPDTVPRTHLHGLNPAHTDEYVLAPLGQVDIQCGPHVLHQTKIWEMRRGKAIPDAISPLTTPVKPSKSRTAQKEKGSPQSQKKSTASTGALPSTSEPVSHAPPAILSATPQAVPSKQTPAPAPPALVASQPQPVPPPPSTASTATAPAPSPPVSNPPRPSPSATGPSSQPTSPPPAAVAAVDPLLVTRVNARAAHSPQLRELLQVAARGAASGEQLRILGIVIQQVTQEMEAEGIKVKGPQTPRAQSPTGPPPRPPPAKPTSQASTPSQSKAAGSESSKGPVKGKGKASPKQSAQSETGQKKAAARPRKSNTSKEKKGKAEQNESIGPEQNNEDTPKQSAEAPPTAIPSSTKAEAASKKKQKPKARVDDQRDSAADASLEKGLKDSATADVTHTGAAVPPAESPYPTAATTNDVKKPRKSGAATSHPRIKGVPIISSTVPPPATRPPVIVLEFAENPATLFYLPLWESLAERSKTAVAEKAEELSLDFETDQANLRARREEIEIRINVLAPETGNLSNAKASAEEQGPAPQQNQSGDNSEGKQPPSDSIPPQPTSQVGPGSKEVRRATRGDIPATPQGFECDPEAQYVFSMSMRTSQNLEAVWDVFGRVPGVRGFEVDGREMPSPEADGPATSDVASVQLSDGKMNPEQAGAQESTQTDARPTGAEQVAQLRETVAQALARLPAQRYLDVDERPPSGLADHLTDQFAPNVVPLQETLVSSSNADRSATTGKRTYRRRQNAAVPSARDFALPSGPTIGEPSASSSTISQAGVKRELASALPMGLLPDSVNQSQEPPRKKRSVATHNPDGSLKLCEHCRASYPPMWRRGPNGPGTLCNACGSRYKAGRLVLAAGGGLTSIAPAPRGGPKR